METTVTKTEDSIEIDSDSEGNYRNENKTELAMLF